MKNTNIQKNKIKLDKIEVQMIIKLVIEEVLKNVENLAVLSFDQLSSVFKGKLSFYEIKERVLDTSFTIRYKTYYNYLGVKEDELLEVVTYIFTKIVVDEDKKEIAFSFNPQICEQVFDTGKIKHLV